MLELTERTLSVMKSSKADEYTVGDPVVNTFHTFAQLNHGAISGTFLSSPSLLTPRLLLEKPLICLPTSS